MSKPDRFYGDPIERFNAMANADTEQTIDRAHFKMWCKIAADEISYLRGTLEIVKRHLDAQRDGVSPAAMSLLNVMDKTITKALK